MVMRRSHGEVVRPLGPALLVEGEAGIGKSTIVVGVLTEFAREQPLLVAIDDVQWVDSESRRALEFAVRRLSAQLRLLVTRRSDGAAGVPLELDRALRS